MLYTPSLFGSVVFFLSFLSSFLPALFTSVSFHSLIHLHPFLSIYSTTCLFILSKFCFFPLFHSFFHILSKNISTLCPLLISVLMFILSLLPLSFQLLPCLSYFTFPPSFYSLPIIFTFSTSYHFPYCHFKLLLNFTYSTCLIFWYSPPSLTTIISSSSPRFLT